MKRTKKNVNPSFIITGDFHLMEKQPVCRTDNFWNTQWDKIRQIGKLSQKYQIPVYHGGDLLDKWKASPYLLNKIIKEFKVFKHGFHSIIGNHDMPQHSIDNMERSGFQTLVESRTIQTIQDQCDWGNDPKKCKPKLPRLLGSGK